MGVFRRLSVEIRVDGHGSSGSAKLLYKYNRKNKKTGEYDDRVMTIFYVLDINPFTSEGATDVPFEFLDPVFLHDEDGVDLGRVRLHASNPDPADGIRLRVVRKGRLPQDRGH